MDKIKEAYIESIKKHKLNVDILCKLHNEKQFIIECWLDEKSSKSPCFSSIYELYMLFNRLDVEIPKELTILIKRSINRVIDTIDSMNVNPLTNKPISKQKRTRTRRSVYYFKGDAVYFREIKKKLNLEISNSTILSRLYKAKKTVGDDIDDVDFTRKNKICEK